MSWTLVGCTPVKSAHLWEAAVMGEGVEPRSQE